MVSGLCTLLLQQFCRMIVHTLNMCTLYFAHLITIFLFLGLLNLDIFPSEMLRGSLVFVICNSSTFHSFISKLSIMIVHTLNMCTLYFAHLITIFLFLGLLNLDIFPSEMLRGSLVFVICNSSTFHSFISKLCIMIVHTLNMCTLYFVGI